MPITMTHTTSVRIFCDGPNHGFKRNAWTNTRQPDLSRELPGYYPDAAAKLIKERKWTALSGPKGATFCPGCAKELKLAPAPA